MGRFVAGHERVIMNLAKAADDRIEAVADALEQGAVLVSNTAKRFHPKLFSGRHPGPEGEAAIALWHETTGHFTSRTGMLSKTITPGDAKWDAGRSQMVVDITATQEYAEKVEAQYPFMLPALMDNEDLIKTRIQTAVDKL